MTIVVFLGPSLSLGDARRHLDALYLPPVGQGDLYRAVRDLRPDAVGIIDGFFHQQPSVWHKEILHALSLGIPVFGGASMGALRAAELDAYGMQGVGAIYEAYRDGRFPPYSDDFEGDDEVAVLHGPAELDWPPLCTPLVDLRHACAVAADMGLIQAGTRDALIAALRTVPFEQRSSERMLAMGLALGLPQDEIGRLEARLASPERGRKELDAIAVLEAIAAWRSRGAPSHEPDFAFEVTTAWQSFVDGEDARLEPDERGVLDILRFEEGDWDVLRREAMLRVAARAGWSMAEADDTMVHRAFEDWRAGLGLTSGDRVRTHAAANDLSEAMFDRVFMDEARHAAAGQSLPGIRRAILDQVRLSGRYGALRARAREIDALLSDAPASAAVPSGLGALALLDRLDPGSGLRLRSVERERLRWAFDDEETMAAALWRHLYSRNHTHRANVL